MVSEEQYGLQTITQEAEEDEGEEKDKRDHF